MLVSTYLHIKVSIEKEEKNKFQHVEKLEKIFFKDF